MNIQSINSVNHNPNFGLKISQSAAYSIIDEFKKEGASDSECAYYLKTIMKSAPDTFELVDYKLDSDMDCCWDGDRLDLYSKICLKNDNKIGEYRPQTSNSYYYEDTDDGPGFSNHAETKIFICEDILKTIKTTIEKFAHLEDKSANYDNIIERANTLVDRSKNRGK